MPINITSPEQRDDINNRSMVAPATRTKSGLTLRAISLGSLELLRQLGNPLANNDPNLDKLDTKTLAEYIWVHAAPQEEVVEYIYNQPSQVAKQVALFSLNIKPSDLAAITSALVADTTAVQAANAVPLPDDDADSPNVRTHP